MAPGQKRRQRFVQSQHNLLRPPPPTRRAPRSLPSLWNLTTPRKLKSGRRRSHALSPSAFRWRSRFQIKVVFNVDQHQVGEDHLAPHLAGLPGAKRKLLSLHLHRSLSLINSSLNSFQSSLRYRAPLMVAFYLFIPWATNKSVFPMCNTQLKQLLSRVDSTMLRHTHVSKGETLLCLMADCTWLHLSSPISCHLQGKNKPKRTIDSPSRNWHNKTCLTKLLCRAQCKSNNTSDNPVWEAFVLGLINAAFQNRTSTKFLEFAIPVLGPV